MTIHEKLSKIQKEFKAKKSRFNSFGKYNFRSAEDILEALKPYNEKYNVYFKVDENYLGDGVIETKASFEFSSTIYTVTPGVGFRSNAANSLATYTAGVLRNYIDADGTTNVVIDGRSADAEGFKTIGTLVVPSASM
jgi:hypothetical protein